MDGIGLDIIANTDIYTLLEQILGLKFMQMASVLYIIGLLNKIITAVLIKIVNLTVFTNIDNNLLDKFLKNRIYGWISWFIDLSIRIKLPKK